MTAPGLPPGHSFFAYGDCTLCTKGPKVQDVSAKGFSEVAEDIKWRMKQHMLDKHGLDVGIDEVPIVVFSAQTYGAPDSEQTVHTEDPRAAAAPEPAAPAGHPGGAPPWVVRRDWAHAAARSRSRSPAREQIPRVVLDALRDDLAVSLTDGRDILNVTDLSPEDLQHLLLKVSAELIRRAALLRRQ